MLIWLFKLHYPQGTMNKKNITISKRHIFSINEEKEGSSILIIVLMLTFIFTSALGISEIIMSSLKMGTVQTYSAKAYFGAESGIEKILWEYKKNSFTVPTSSKENILNGNMPNNSSYVVNYVSSSDVDYNYDKYISIGKFNNVKRSVEVSFKFPK